MTAAALVAASGTAAALEDISGSVTLASDYVFRGVSQTNNKAAIQG
ncbi:MAG: hypothetical protein PVJ15_09575, partial [Gammaproteobacteria bacterium]